MRFSLLCLVAVSACGTAGSGSTTAGSGPVVRDSAGIRIVENSGPAWTGPAGWSVVDSPLVDIGGVAGDPAYDLSQVNTVVRLSDGRLAAAVGGAFQVRFFDPAGTHLTSSGAKGSGPGEYQGIGGMWLLPGDSVMVLDLFARRLTVLDDSGKVRRTFSLGGAGGFPTPGEGGRMSFAVPLGIFGDGSVLGMLQSFSLSDKRQGAYRDSVTYIVYGPDGLARDTVGHIPGMEMEQVAMTFGPRSFSAPSPVPLGRNTITAVTGERVFLGLNNAWEIEERDAGGAVRRIIRIHQEPRRITPEQVAAHRAQTRKEMEEQPMLRNVPEQMRKQIFDRVDHATYPATFPFIVAILTSADGMLWVHEQGSPGDDRRTLALIDSTGRFLGRLQLPDRFRPTFVGGDLLAGVWRDPDDVEHVRVYRVRKSS
jgi:hypothetical protein